MNNVTLNAMYSKYVLLESYGDLVEAIIVFSEEKGTIQDIIVLDDDILLRDHKQQYYKDNYNFKDYSEYVVFPGVILLFDILANRLSCIYACKFYGRKLF